MSEGHELSRRLNIVIPYLYPDIIWGKDYSLENHNDGKGTILIWLSKTITAPTDDQLANAKKPAVEDAWWQTLRSLRNSRLQETDWSQSPDVPTKLKDKYADYRQKLRDLPATVSKPAYEELIKLREVCETVESFLPTKPE